MIFLAFCLCVGTQLVGMHSVLLYSPITKNPTVKFLTTNDGGFEYKDPFKQDSDNNRSNTILESLTAQKKLNNTKRMCKVGIEEVCILEQWPDLNENIIWIVRSKISVFTNQRNKQKINS